MKRVPIGLLLLALVLAGCNSGNRARILASPYNDGVKHTEPVFFNGKNYDVAFRYRPQQNIYDVNVSGRGGRRLGGGKGDQKIVEEIAGSAVRHFACANGQKASIVPGSARHTGSSWSMSAACA